VYPMLPVSLFFHIWLPFRCFLTVYLMRYAHNQNIGKPN